MYWVTGEELYRNILHQGYRVWPAGEALPEAIERGPGWARWHETGHVVTRETCALFCPPYVKLKGYLEATKRSDSNSFRVIGVTYYLAGLHVGTHPAARGNHTSGACDSGFFASKTFMRSFEELFNLEYGLQAPETAYQHSRVLVTNNGNDFKPFNSTVKYRVGEFDEIPPPLWEEEGYFGTRLDCLVYILKKYIGSTFVLLWQDFGPFRTHMVCPADCVKSGEYLGMYSSVSGTFWGCHAELREIWGIWDQQQRIVQEMDSFAQRHLYQQADLVSKYLFPGGWVITGSGLSYIDIIEGSGPNPGAGQFVSVHYVFFLENGTKFDDSHDREGPLEFQVGVGDIIPGLCEGILTMAVGGKRRLKIPPSLAYGERGAGGVIPPNATLILDLELARIDSQKQDR